MNEQITTIRDDTFQWQYAIAGIFCAGGSLGGWLQIIEMISH